MKKWIQIIVCGVVLIGGGAIMTVSGNNNTHHFTKAMNSGEQALDKGQYDNAVVSFEQATNYRPSNGSSKSLLKQTQAIVAADNFYQDKQFIPAMQQYQKALDIAANKRLTRIAKQGVKINQALVNNYRQFVWNYNLALHLNQQGDFKQSNDLLNRKLLTAVSINETQYQKIMNVAKTLQKANANKKTTDAPVQTIAKVITNLPAITEGNISPTSTLNENMKDNNSKA